MKISVCIITFNEEVNIEKCIYSLIDIADEIIVVDSGSTDSTIDLCQKISNKIKIFKNKFIGYGNQKRVAVGYTKNDWILSIDADEWVSDSLRLEILNLGDNRSYRDIVAYKILRKSYFLGKLIKHGTWKNDYVTRLFNKNHMNFNQKKIHENVEAISLGNKKNKINKLHHCLFHNTIISVDEAIEKSISYNSGSAILDINKKSNLVKIILNPMFAFFRSYFLKLGFLDGKEGYFVAKFIAQGTAIKYISMYELQLQKKNNFGNS